MDNEGGDVTEPLTVRVETTDGVAVVTLTGELDLGGAPSLETALSGLEGSVRSVVIDLSGLLFMDSTGLAAIVQAKHQADSVNRRLQLRGATGTVSRLLEISAIADTIEVID